jgi:hypothetical protein
VDTRIISDYDIDAMMQAFGILDSFIRGVKNVRFEEPIESVLRATIERDFPDNPQKDKILEMFSIMLHLGIIMGEQKRGRVETQLLQ